MIQRYENNGYMEDFRPEPKGEWVKYEDHKERVERLEAALRNLHSLVWGECPSLLNEDSGGDAKLDLEIRALLTNDAGEGA